jgi:hypothetical protein
MVLYISISLNPKNLMKALFSLPFLLLLASCASVKQSLMAEVDAKYDKFTDTTVFKSRPNEVLLREDYETAQRTGSADIRFEASCSGKHENCTPEHIDFTLEIDVVGRTFDDVYEIRFLADQTRISAENVNYRLIDNTDNPNTTQKVNYRNKEVFKGRINLKDLEALANATKIEGKMGNVEFRVMRIMPQRHLYNALTKADFQKVYFE